MHKLLISVVVVAALGACGSGGSKNASSFCRDAKALRNKYSLADYKNPNNSAPIARAWLSFLKSAPKEISADATIMADAFDPRLKGGATGNSAVQEKDFETAGQHLATYVHDKCGVDLAPTG